MVVVIISCEKEVVEPSRPPLPPIPIYTDTTTLDSLNDLSNPLKGQTWVITGIRVGDIGNMITISDTLVFLSNNVYICSENISKISSLKEILYSYKILYTESIHELKNIKDIDYLKNMESEKYRLK